MIMDAGRNINLFRNGRTVEGERTATASRLRKKGLKGVIGVSIER
jgi:hypothetical protein